jgi:putative ABC transport system permease protein
MIILKLAWRNILRNKRRTVFTVSMMTFGYVLFSFFIALGDGAYSNIINQFINARTGEYQVHKGDYLEHPKLYKTISHYKKTIQKIEAKSEVKGVAPRIHGGALAFNQNKTVGATVWGVDFNKEAKLTTLPKRITSGELPKSYGEVIIGKKVAKVLGLKLDEELILISSGADGSIANDKYIVKGIIAPEEGGQDDFMVYMSLDSAQEFFSMWGQVHSLMIRTNLKLEEMRKISLGEDLTLSSWKEVEADFYKAMLADKKGDEIGRYIIMFLVAIGVLNTVLMSILERTKEFGVLKAIGTRPLMIFNLIILETVFIALISIVFGIVIAYGVNSYFALYGISFEKPIEYGGMVFDTMRAVVDLHVFISPIGTVLISAILVSLYPAYKAARVIPVEAMHE